LLIFFFRIYYASHPSFGPGNFLFIH
jgi:hypothetical protein